MKLVKPSFQIITPRIDEKYILRLLEHAARKCYQSQDKMNESYNDKFLSNMIKNGHESTIEHYAMSVDIICDRGVLGELTRHRLASFSVESTRYCNYSKQDLELIIPYWCGKIKEGMHCEDDDLRYVDGAEYLWLKSMLAAEYSYTELIEATWTPQQARSVLPLATKVDMTMSANLREWRHIFNLRCSNKSHPQMRELMLPMLSSFKMQIPVIFDDIFLKYFTLENTIHDR